jgi:tripartite-type tricarboxylate transporter receptor subunit TctC
MGSQRVRRDATPRLAYAALAAASLLAAAPGTEAATQPYPSKPIHIIVPFSAGGITDILGRALAQRLTETFGQQVVVENKPGGGTGQVGAEYVAKSAPDGTTLLVTADATLVTAPHVYSKLPYDALNDFAPITGLGISPQALIVNPTLPVKTVGELVALAKSKPGAINYGTFGIGSSGHLNIILIEGMTGASFTPVHYRGAAPAITDVIGGHIQMMIVSIGLITQPWQAGQLRVLGFGSSTRLPQYPDVPTLAESGLADYEAGSWYGLVAPKGTPPEIVEKLNAATRRIFEEPAFQEKFLAPSFIFPIVSSPEDFAARIRAEWAKWGKVIKDANVKAD